MFEIRPFRVGHLVPLLEQPINAHVKRDFYKRTFDVLEKQESFSCFYNDEIQVCGGISPIWPGRGIIWSVFNEQSKNNFLPTFRAMKQFMKMSMAHYARLEVAVPVGFKIGHKRAKALGFLLECECAKKYTPQGEDCSIYVMVG